MTGLPMRFLNLHISVLVSFFVLPAIAVPSMGQAYHLYLGQHQPSHSHFHFRTLRGNHLHHGVNPMVGFPTMSRAGIRIGYPNVFPFWWSAPNRQVDYAGLGAQMVALSQLIKEKQQTEAMKTKPEKKRSTSNLLYSERGKPPNIFPSKENSAKSYPRIVFLAP